MRSKHFNFNKILLWQDIIQGFRNSFHFEKRVSVIVRFSLKFEVKINLIDHGYKTIN